MVKNNRVRVLLVFYGDDFTGTTATAEALTEAGVPTVVFTKLPPIAFLAEHFPRVRAVGLAGIARTLSPEKLAEVLPPIFETMKDYQAPIVLYKVCSTFDSSPRVGNIGRAIELGREIFASDLVPVLPAAPHFGRFTVFGHHFAALGQGEIYRLDRHPSMAQHPVTPMQESDLRLHLAKQTKLKSGLIDVLALDEGRERVEALLDDWAAAAMPIVFFDCLYERHLILACEVLWHRASRQHPLFCVGSQELGYGFAAAWRKGGLLPVAADHGEEQGASDRGPLFVLSGSCAIVNGQQIRRAVENGFVDIEIRPEKLIDPSCKDLEQERIVGATLSALKQNDSVVAHTAMGATDSRIDMLRQKAEELSLSSEAANEILGNALGEIALKVIQSSRVKRLVIAGGDTTGRVQKHLGLQALQVAKPIGTGAPLCYVYSSLSQVNGLEIAFKGGQTGQPDYFEKVRDTQVADFTDAALGRL